MAKKGKPRALKRQNKARKSPAQASKSSGTQKKAFLQFPPGHGISGLTPISLSLGANREASIVREILQNSLDAARQKGEKCAYVRFSLENIPIADIPGIEEYEKAVNSIAQYYESKDWPEQSKEIINGFRDGLNKQELPVLFVSDNGIGLNRASMTAILSDGATEKGGEKASGSHGNGHFTTFNLSKMRYILYGGISSEGQLASGHALLAKHQGKDANGYFLVGFSKSQEEPYQFPENEQVPSLLQKRLDKIKSEWDTGTVLAIVDFNFFGEEEQSSSKMQEVILGSAAQNFFVAIRDGQLQVTVKSGKEESKLTKDNLGDILENVSPRVPHVAGFPTHKVAKQFYELLSDCYNKELGTGVEEIETGYGSFQFLFRQKNVKSPKIALCRNGMWITHAIPSIRTNDFVDKVPFEGLLLCDVDSKVLHSLVRKAESNLHNSIKLNFITDFEKRAKLRKALQETKRIIRDGDFIKKQDAGFKDFLPIKSDSIEEILPPERIGRAGPGGGGGSRKGGGSDRKKSKSKSKPGRSLFVRSVAVKDGINCIKIRFTPKTSSPDAELKLVLNGGSDISCSGNESTSIDIKKATYDDGTLCPVADGLARLGKMTEGEVKTVTVEFQSSVKIKTDDYRVDCQFIRRAATSSENAAQPPVNHD